MAPILLELTELQQRGVTGWPNPLTLSNGVQGSHDNRRSCGEKVEKTGFDEEEKLDVCHFLNFAFKVELARQTASV